MSGLNASPTALFVHAHALHLTLYWHKKNNLDWKLIGAVPFMVNWKMFGETLYLVLKRKQQIKCSQRGGGVSPLMKYCTKHKLRKLSLWKLSNAICSVSDATVHLYNLQLNTGRFILNQILLFLNYIPITFYLFSTKSQHVHQLTLCWKVKTVQ